MCRFKATVPYVGEKFVKCKYVKGRYISPFEYKKHSFGGLWEELMWKFSNKFGKLNISDTVRKSFSMKSYLDKSFQDDKGNCKAQVTWLGHSTCIIQVDGKFILTDPIWSQRAFPYPFSIFFGPVRDMDAPIEVCNAV